MDEPNHVLRLPSADDGAVKAEIVEWFVNVGTRVVTGQLLCTIETDKSVVDVTAPFDGWVSALGGTEGEMLEVGSVLLVASAEPPPPAESSQAETSPGGEPGAGDDVDEGGSGPGDAVAGDAVAGDAGPATIDQAGMVSPLVRRLAEEFGVDLATLAGTGPDGRITRADVQRAAFGTVIGEPDTTLAGVYRPDTAETTITSPTEAARASDDVVAGHRPTHRHEPADGHHPADPVPPATNLMITTPTAGTEAVKPIRATVTAGRANAAADPTGATLTLYREVEVEQLLQAHERLDTTIDGGLPLEALLMRLALPALVEHARLNARVTGDGELVPAEHYDIAFTCVTDRGLAVPVIRQVNDRSLRALGRAVAELSARSRRGHLLPAETSGQTFTIHNLGPLGVTAGNARLPTGTAALVSYGRPRPTLRLVAGTPREVPVMTVGVTVDHRVLDDGEAARFLGKISLYLEQPILAFTD